MKALKLNLELSEEILNEMIERDESIEMRGCYNNTFKVVSFLRCFHLDEAKNYKIAYGFIDKKVGDERMFFRHAFLIDTRDNSVIDVTACLWTDKENEFMDYNYYVFTEYSNFDCYIDDIIKEDRQPGLYATTLKNEVIIFNKLNEMGLSINPIDLMDLMHRAYGDNFLEKFKVYEESNKIIL